MNAPVTINLGFSPYPHQREAHAFDERFRVLVWHRRAGKTVFAVMELVLAALRCERRMGRFGYVAPYLRQAKEIAWAYLTDYARKIPGSKINEAESWIEVPNAAGDRSRIRIYGADNPDSLRGGYFDGVVLDEVADMRSEVWGEIVRPMLADREGWALFIGTPKGVNQFSELFHSALGGRPGWRADLRRAVDTGVIAPAELEAARQEMTPNEFAQEFECDFSAAQTNALLSLEQVLAAQRRAVAAAAYQFAPKVLGVDVAREGDDQSCLFLRQGLIAYQPRALRPTREDALMELADAVVRVIEEQQVDVCFIDRTGIGSGTLDRLRQLGYQNVIGIDFGAKPSDPKFENKRTEMWLEMAGWVKGGGCLPAHPAELAVDLTAPQYVFRTDKGKQLLESKADLKKRIKRSPDVGDALALTFAMPVPMRTALDRAQMARPQEYVPFARSA